MSGIVVGVNRSATARRAAAKATELAAKLGEPLHVVMATKPGRSQVIRRGGDVFVQDWVEEARAFMRRLSQELGVGDATVAIGGTDPARALCAEARRLDASLIVVGNRRAQGPMRVLGSVAADVVRRAPCDVFVAHTAAPHPLADAADPRAQRTSVDLTSAPVVERCSSKEGRAIEEPATRRSVAAGQELTRAGDFGVFLDGTARVTIDGDAAAGDPQPAPLIGSAEQSDLAPRERDHTL